MSEIRDKYGEPRKTEICTDYSEIDIGDLIEKEDVVISMTHLGYVKRPPITEYHTQNAEEKELRLISRARRKIC